MSFMNNTNNNNGNSHNIFLLLGILALGALLLGRDIKINDQGIQIETKEEKSPEIVTTSPSETTPPSGTTIINNNNNNNKIQVHPHTQISTPSPNQINTQFPR